jgi:hypothetical protein
MFLELATTTRAVIGALLAAAVFTRRPSHRHHAQRPPDRARVRAGDRVRPADLVDRPRARDPDLADLAARPSGLVALGPSVITRLGWRWLLATLCVRVAALGGRLVLDIDRHHVVITLAVLAILPGGIFPIR